MGKAMKAMKKKAAMKAAAPVAMKAMKKKAAMKAMKAMKKKAAMKAAAPVAMKAMKKKAVMKAAAPVAMKAMKKKAAMKAMKAMKKKIVSKIAKGRFSKSLVLRGTKAKTAGGLVAKDLIRNKAGKIVSKKASAASKKNFAKGLGDWNNAVKKARTILALKGFVAIKKGSPLYTKAKEIYNH